jgi:polar amino acid transport system permease protein
MEVDFSQFSIERLIDRFFNIEIIREWAHLLPPALKNTLLIAALSFVVGIVLGMVVALGSISHRTWLRGMFRTYIEFWRGIPLLVAILFIHFSFPLIGIRFEPFVSGSLALCLQSAAFTAEIFRAGIESVERGQVEGARSLGLSYRDTMRVAVLPQAVRRVVPPLTNELVTLVKDSSLVAVIGVSELLRVAQIATGATFNASMYTVVAAVYLSITLPLTYLARRLEKRFVRRGSLSWLEAERQRRIVLRHRESVPVA